MHSTTPGLQGCQEVDKWNPFKVEAPTDKVIEIDPTKDFGGLTAGIDKDNFAVLEKNGKLKELALIHQPEKWAPPFRPEETEELWYHSV
jgi:hypothetical protein